MKTGVSRLDRLLALVFPQRCLLCGRITIGGQRVCERCLKENPPRTLFSRVDETGRAIFQSRCSAFQHAGMAGRFAASCCAINSREDRRKQLGFHRRS